MYIVYDRMTGQLIEIIMIEGETAMSINESQYDNFIEIAEGIYWVGFADEHAGFHCNPYLIVDNDEAVLIDSGGRNDFSTVMLKIMRTGTNPKNIKRLIYQHYDPDLCGNIPHMEAMIDNKDLRIISQRENILFINYYSVKSPMQCIDDLGLFYEFSSGRRLEFIHTPYCHAPGSFITYDTKAKVLFTSDIFAAYDSNWTFYTKIDENCLECDSETKCAVTGDKCQMTGMVDFHRRVMPSSNALKHAIECIEKLDISIIAPQHGSIHDSATSRRIAMKRLKSLDKVGFEYLNEG